MKRIISLILTVALFASLCICATTASAYEVGATTISGLPEKPASTSGMSTKSFTGIASGYANMKVAETTVDGATFGIATDPNGGASDFHDVNGAIELYNDAKKYGRKMVPYINYGIPTNEDCIITYNFDFAFGNAVYGATRYLVVEDTNGTQLLKREITWSSGTWYVQNNTNGELYKAQADTPYTLSLEVNAKTGDYTVYLSDGTYKKVVYTPYTSPAGQLDLTNGIGNVYFGYSNTNDTAGNSLIIYNLSVTKTASEPIVVTKSANSAYAETTITLTSDDAINSAELIIAAYNGDQLTAITSETTPLYEGANSVDVTLSDLNGGTTVKVFLWDSLTGATPLAVSVVK